MLGELVCVRCLAMGYLMPLLCWLVLLIRPWSSSQILSGKGANNGQFERGQLVELILTKAVFACKRLWW